MIEVLTEQQVQRLFVTLRRLSQSGKTIVLITHKLAEVRAVADRVTVMRRGRTVAVRPAAEVDEKELTARALGVGRQYAAQHRVRNAESVSALLFATARQVVADQGLLEPAPDLAERRQAFMDELRTILADIDRMGLVSTRQFRERETSARASGREAS